MNSRQRRKYRRAFDRRSYRPLSKADEEWRKALIKERQKLLIEDFFAADPVGQWSSPKAQRRTKRINQLLDRLESKESGLD